MKPLNIYGLHDQDNDAVLFAVLNLSACSICDAEFEKSERFKFWHDNFECVSDFVWILDEADIISYTLFPYIISQIDHSISHAIELILIRQYEQGELLPRLGDWNSQDLSRVLIPGHVNLSCLIIKASIFNQLKQIIHQKVLPPKSETFPESIRDQVCSVIQNHFLSELLNMVHPKRTLWLDVIGTQRSAYQSSEVNCYLYGRDLTIIGEKIDTELKEKMMEAIRCPSCGHQLMSGDDSIKKPCPNCGVVISFDKQGRPFIAGKSDKDRDKKTEL